MGYKIVLKAQLNNLFLTHEAVVCRTAEIRLRHQVLYKSRSIIIYLLGEIIANKETEYKKVLHLYVKIFK